MLNPDQKILIEFVEDRAIRLPIRKRIKVYRGLADFIDDRSVANPLVQKAQILEDAESKCTQLNLKFPGARPARRPRRSSLPRRSQTQTGAKAGVPT
jgi:hypothetical protein